MRVALVFVHGISATPNDVAKMRERVGAFAALHGFCGGYVAGWRSLGTWRDDLIDLALHPQRRFEAVQDVRNGITDVAAKADVDGLLVVGHSMGQVMALGALSSRPPVPAKLLSLGGPLGNASPAVRDFVGWARAFQPPAVREWVDVWNREDPVCTDGVLGLGPAIALSVLRTVLPDEITPAREASLSRLPSGYMRPSRCDRSIEVAVPSVPSLANPVAEHSSYFNVPDVVKLVEEMGRTWTT